MGSPVSAPGIGQAARKPALRRLGSALAGLFIALLLLAIALILWPAAGAPLPTPGRDLVIANVRVVDVERGLAGLSTSVTIRGGVITAIGPPAAGHALPVIDGGGGYLVPGFWDMHMHSFQLSPQLHLPLFLANGVTSVRDMMDCPGERDSLIACLADKKQWTAKAEAGRLASPRFVSIASYYFEDPALTPAEASARAGAYAARGLDELKVYNRLSRPAYFRVAAEARRSGMRLTGHLPKAVALEEALASGHRSFEHAHVLVRHCFARSEDWRAGRLEHMPPTRLARFMVLGHDRDRCRRTYEALRRSGAWLVPTHVTREEDARAGDPAFLQDSRLAYLDPLSRWAFRDDLAGTRAEYPGREGEEALGRYFRLGLRLTGEAHRAGVPILVGTDTALGGFRYHDEMAHLVRAGLSPAAVLRAATLDAARFAGLESSAGSVTVGKRADLVLLDSNPLENIANTRRIRLVLLAGR
ncbi:MAG TPA: amidohydrolase family protein, partial [Allosphingosinicella sp.]